MYLGAQRVIDDSGPSVTLYLYLHGDGLPTSHRAMLSDVRWISQLAPGQLARERHDGKAGGRSIVSYLEVSGPDETDIGSLRGVLDALNEHVATGGKEPIVKEAWGADFFCGAEGRAPLEELGDLRVRLEQFFEDGGTMPPDRDLTIEVSRAGDMTFFRWDGESYDKLAVEAPAGWRPFRFSISDEVRDAFERQHGVLFPHVMEVLRPDDKVDLEALGGVAFKDESTRKVLWFSPRKVG